MPTLYDNFERVRQYIDEHSGNVDLSSYVSYSYLESKHYLTEHQDLSAYVTKVEMSNAGYLTAVPSDYPTYAAISSMGYITMGDVSACGYITSIPSEYITQDELSANAYLTSVPNDYPTYAAISSMGYITSIPSEYVTQDELSANAYITINDVPTVDLSSYVSYAYLESKQYLDAVPSDYPTYAAISDMAYVTSSDLPVINENIIPKATNTYTLGDASHIYSNTYSRGVYLGTGVRMFSEGSASSDDIAISLGGVSYFYLNTNRFAPNGALNNEKLDLGTADRKWNHIYGKSVNVDATYTSNLYADTIHNFIWTGTSAQYAALDNYTSYQIYLIQEA